MLLLPFNLGKRIRGFKNSRIRVESLNTRLLLSTEKNTRNVIIKNVNHKNNQDKNSNLLGYLTHLCIDRFSDDGFDKKEEQMPAV